MSTTQIAAALFELQQLDLELDRLVSEEQAVTNALQGNSGLQKMRAEYNIAQQHLRTGLQGQKEAEWALEELSQRLSAQEKRLYSGTVNNPKELYSLQQEVQRLRAQQNRQEDMALEVMEAAESLQEIAHRKAEALEQAEAAWARESEILVARRDQLAARKQELQARRAQMASSIDAEILSRYDAMRRTIEQNSCQWCRVILTPSELQHVRTSKDLQTCTNCGRILYYDR